MGDQEPTSPCPVCGAEPQPAGTRTTTFSGDRVFLFAGCGACGYTWIVNPRTDFDLLYDADYYAGKGADPLTDYQAELANPRTIRTYEWSGLLDIVAELGDQGEQTRWLDFGCGLGGAIRYAVAQGFPHAVGFDEGYAAEVLARDEVPHIQRGDFPRYRDHFDVISSIDVIEHVTDPIGFLREIAALLRPGGTLFLTTGNAEPYRGRITKWSYSSVPEVHIGFFEPRTLRAAYRVAGLEPIDAVPPQAFDSLLRYKILKNLHVKNRSRLEQMTPWGAVCSMVDRKYRLRSLPMGRRAES